MDAYREDLAHIHDSGYGAAAKSAASVLIEELRNRSARLDQDHQGLIVDLGCGSGILAQEMSGAGFGVWGIDISASMIALARQRAPQGTFRQGSFLNAELPRCVAVASIGECFNYVFDPEHSLASVNRMFERVYEALEPGGVFLFDVASSGREFGSGPQQRFRESEDWTVLVSAEEDRQNQILTRTITSFRKVGDGYRRDREIHRQRLFAKSAIATSLRELGFRVRMLRGYDDYAFGRGGFGILARKRSNPKMTRRIQT